MNDYFGTLNPGHWQVSRYTSTRLTIFPVSSFLTTDLRTRPLVRTTSNSGSDGEVETLVLLHFSTWERFRDRGEDFLLLRWWLVQSPTLTVLSGTLRVSYHRRYAIHKVFTFDTDKVSHVKGSEKSSKTGRGSFREVTRLGRLFCGL